MVNIPGESLDELRCSKCHNYLAYFPIMQSIEGELFCGQCYNSVLEKTSHVRIFEIVARHLQFPCRYSHNGCLENYIPSEIEQHEINCNFKTLTCPLSTSANCTWSGFAPEIKKHCENYHPGQIMKNNDFEIEFPNFIQEENLIEHETEFFVFKRRYTKDTKQFAFSILNIQNRINPIEYKIMLFNKKQDRSVEFSSKSQNTISDISLEAVQHIVNDSSLILGKIVFPEKHNNSTNFQSNLEFKINCEECHNHMVSTIKMCTNGHGICSYCKSTDQICYLCRSTISEYKPDFLFLNLVSQIVQPCKYHSVGCQFYSKLEYIEKHEKFCQFAPQKCPVKTYTICSWNGMFKDIFEHLKTNHPNDLKDINQEFELEMDEDTFYQGYYSITKFTEKLFLLYTFYRQNKIYWSLQLIGPETQSVFFKYDITIRDKIGGNLIMCVRKNCSSLKEKRDQCFQNGAEYVCVKWKQIKDNIIGNQFSYKVDILKT